VLQFYDDDGTDDDNNNETVKGAITMFLVGSATMWMILNVVFLCTIDMSFLPTFFWTKSAPQYTCELFSKSKEDWTKFRAVFENRTSYAKNIHREVKEWVANNINRWKEEKQDWFKIEMIPDDLLSRDVLEAVGGAKRRRVLQMKLLEQNARRGRPGKRSRRRSTTRRARTLRESVRT